MTGMHKCCEGHLNIELIEAGLKKKHISRAEQKLACYKV